TGLPPALVFPREGTPMPALATALAATLGLLRREPSPDEDGHCRPRVGAPSVVFEAEGDAVSEEQVGVIALVPLDGGAKLPLVGQVPKLILGPVPQKGGANPLLEAVNRMGR